MGDCLTLETFTDHREWAVDGVPVLTADLSLPRPSGPGAESGAARRIARYYRLYARAYLRYCERWLFPQSAMACAAAMENSTPLPQDAACLSYCAASCGGGVLSVHLDAEERCGGQTERRRRGDTWDLATGYPIPLSACFPKNFPWKRELLRRTEEEIRRQIRAGAGRYHEDWQKRLRKGFNPENFYLSETALHWFFPMYAIAPASAGIPVFSLPYCENVCFFPGNHGMIEKTPLE